MGASREELLDPGCCLAGTSGHHLKFSRPPFLICGVKVICPERGQAVGPAPGNTSSSTFCMTAGCFYVGILAQYCQIFHISKSISNFRFLCETVQFV